MQDTGKVIALLIDAENISPKYVQCILDEVSLYGTPAYKRIYGNWTAADMVNWKKVLLEYSITPMQQFNYTQGKNATDSAMIIDAMDILYSGNVDGFCLVSSDSDFTRLAARLRESRMYVIGMGENKTPTAFKAACDTFKYLEVLLGADQKAQPKPAAKQPAQKPRPKPAKQESSGAKPAEKQPERQPEPERAPQHIEAGYVPLDEIVAKIQNIIDYDSDEEGYMSLSLVGVMLGRMYADFDSRNYGFNKLHKLIDAVDQFETKCEVMPGGSKNLLVRNK